MDRAGFQRILARELYPILRSEGFKGSGSTLRRLEVPIVHVFNFQGSSSGERCYINLGAHLTLVQPEGGGVVAPEEFTEPHCIFRTRLEPMESALGWSYGNSDDETKATIEAIIDAWSQQGRAFFARYSSYPDGFACLLAETNPEDLHPRFAMHYARIAIQLGDLSQALKFVQSALPRVPERATTLQFELAQLLKSIQESA